MEYQHSNSAFGARNPFAATKPQARAHYYMTYISGPLVIPKLYNGRNRTFFLFGYDGYTTPGGSSFPRMCRRFASAPVTSRAFPQSCETR